MTKLPPLIKAMLSDETCPNEVLRDALMEGDIHVPKVYVVTGETGEYSDHIMWDVCGFLDVAEAWAYIDRLKEWGRETKADVLSKESVGKPSSVLKMEWDFDDRPEKCPLDSEFHSYYNGVTYWVNEIDLKG